MAITAYCGVMGSGKSYEVVSGPLLEAVASGRRVVTNIDGVNESLVLAYVEEKMAVPAERLGSIVHVRTDDMLQEGFFPVEVEGSDGATVTPGFVKAGDLLVVDEAWKLWAVGKKITAEHMAFFRMHRHFTHEVTGVSCDVVLMIQSIADLHRSIKAVVELSFRMVKLKSVGMSKSYRVEMYETAKQTKTSQTGTFVRKYKAEIFPLYKSYAGAGGVEKTVDKRQNVLARRSLWLMVAGVVVLLGVASWFAYRFFHPAMKGRGAAVSHAVPATAASASLPPAAPAPSHVSDTWRVAGKFRSGGLAWLVLADDANRLRLVSPADFFGAGLAATGVVDGDRVSAWSGGRSAPSPLGGGVK